MKKMRLDEFCVFKNICKNIDQAKRMIMAGLIHDGANKLTTPGQMVKFDSEIYLVKSNLSNKYVSRGGLKLDYGLKNFKIDVKNLIAADVGSSTGGFTDCLLKHGAKKVYAIDSGYNQLDYKLRIHPQVVSLEKHNFRNFDKPELNDHIDFAVCDVSFISLKHIFPPLVNILKNNHYFLCLIKPEFEAKRFEVINGKVNDVKVEQRVIEEVKGYASVNHFDFIGLCESPILGRVKKNREFLALFQLKKNN